MKEPDMYDIICFSRSKEFYDNLRQKESIEDFEKRPIVNYDSIFLYELRRYHLRKERNKNQKGITPPQVSFLN